MGWRTKSRILYLDSLLVWEEESIKTAQTIDSVVLAGGYMQMMPKYDRKDDQAILGADGRITKVDSGRARPERIADRLSHPF